jgi:hypothetical protein
MQKNAIQNDGLQSICFDVKSCLSAESPLIAFERFASGKTTSAPGFLSIIPAIIITTPITAPNIMYVLLKPKLSFSKRILITLPKSKVLTPKPIISEPEQKPFLSGNHAQTVETTTLYAIPMPVPAKIA